MADLEKMNTTWTGFLEFAPRDPGAVAKYSALSSTWTGVESSEKAVADGVFDLDKAEAARRELREGVPQMLAAGEKKEERAESAWDSPEAFWRYIRKSLGY